MRRKCALTAVYLCYTIELGAPIRERKSPMHVKAESCVLHHVTYLGDEVHTPLALFLLKLERNASYWAPLNALHEVRHKASDLVPHPLGWDDGNLVTHPLVRVEVHGQARVVLLDDGTSRLLHGLRADTLKAQSVKSSCRLRQKAGLEFDWLTGSIRTRGLGCWRVPVVDV